MAITAKINANAGSRVRSPTQFDARRIATRTAESEAFGQNMARCGESNAFRKGAEQTVSESDTAIPSSLRRRPTRSFLICCERAPLQFAMVTCSAGANSIFTNSSAGVIYRSPGLGGRQGVKCKPLSKVWFKSRERRSGSSVSSAGTTRSCASSMT